MQLFVPMGFENGKQVIPRSPFGENTKHAPAAAFRHHPKTECY
jgi:hypothetical protein